MTPTRLLPPPPPLLPLPRRAVAQQRWRRPGLSKWLSTSRWGGEGPRMARKWKKRRWCGRRRRSWRCRCRCCRRGRWSSIPLYLRCVCVFLAPGILFVGACGRRRYCAIVFSVLGVSCPWCFILLLLLLVADVNVAAIAAVVSHLGDVLLAAAASAVGVSTL